MISSLASGGIGVPSTAAELKSSERNELVPDLARKVHELMLKARVLEERLIAMYKQGDGYFWIGGPGEEALNVPLGLLVNKGQGLDHDYLHLHYRSNATVLAMGADPVDWLRQMKSTATDPYSRGRNFAGHTTIRKWNVVPINSPIEVQFSVAIGTAEAQRKAKSKGITIVQGGDAGTAEGDFATCLVWSSRKGSELPLLIVVANNQYGISTPFEGQHGEAHIADRAKAFGIQTALVDGNDPEMCTAALTEAFHYVRTQRKPCLLEATVSRLYGHSSATGAKLVRSEVDCMDHFEQKLEERKILTRAQMNEMRARFTAELLEASLRVREEPPPLPHTIWDYVLADKNNVGNGKGDPWQP
ncbi:MAG: thiamine pyrophosphate-dependent dehydrogenase E1 component subunit alpha [Polyangiaceae bacterium]|nr:thiamine pyrophosphate-dependent dehydrogenase E1 component subunit alpha [Polyangiaceae bacterium]